MDFARELKRLHDEGWTYKRIAEIACKNEEYIRSYKASKERFERNRRLLRGTRTRS